MNEVDAFNAIEVVLWPVFALLTAVLGGRVRGMIRVPEISCAQLLPQGLVSHY